MKEGQDIVFKGLKDGLYLTFNDNREFSTLKRKLQDHLKKAEYFFSGSDVVLDTGEAELSLEEILEVQHILAYPYGLRLKKIVHGKEAPPVKVERPSRVPPSQTAHAPSDAGVQRRAVRPRAGEMETLLHRGTLRSGQKITHRGNVVIMGNVNPGAEIRASGDIAVLGVLRGLAHAGAEGDTDVCVVAFQLAPTQLRIAGVIGRPPDDGAATAKEPEVARLKDGMIVVEPLEGTRWEGDH